MSEIYSQNSEFSENFYSVHTDINTLKRLHDL